MAAHRLTRTCSFGKNPKKKHCGGSARPFKNKFVEEQRTSAKHSAPECRQTFCFCRYWQAFGSSENSTILDSEYSGLMATGYYLSPPYSGSCLPELQGLLSSSSG